MQSFLRLDRHQYFRGRSSDHKKEQALLYCEDEQNYIAYRKGALVMYALSEYLGETHFNKILQSYLQSVQYQGPPYTTSLAFFDHLQQSTPDSLHYLLDDWLNKITIYHHKMIKAEAVPLVNGNYRVDLEFIASKYQSDGYGRRNYRNAAGDSLMALDPIEQELVFSQPLADYLPIGIFAEPQEGQSEEMRRLAEHFYCFVVTCAEIRRGSTLQWQHAAN